MTTILTIVLSVVLSAQMDSTQLWIGDQTGLHLEATASEGEQVVFPVFNQKIQDGIEVVEQGKIDTTFYGDDIYRYVTVDGLQDGDKIEIRGFGSLTVRKRRQSVSMC